MKILITGNLGYVGAYVCQYLRDQYPQALLAGYDLGYFRDCLTTRSSPPENCLDIQYRGDVRKFDESILKGIDHVVHLAAISNDPIGNRFEQVTMDVNYKASVDIATKAANQGVKSFVFASSCSVYGAAGDEAKTEQSEVNPLTAYARSKVMTEQALQQLKDDRMIITCLRFATACGMSDRLRLDLVLNDFVASAVTSRSITILSDGTPWRPLINVRDMARAIDWAMTRPAEKGGRFLICNTGCNQWNFTVKELAGYVKQVVPEVEVHINESAPPDKRSYRVNFDLFKTYANGHSPVSNITSTIHEIKNGLSAIRFTDTNFRHSKLMRLNVLNRLLQHGKLDADLNWISG